MQYNEKIRQLEQENDFLKKTLKKRGYFHISTEDKFSTSDKIEVFLSYFKGRSDVYAKRYISKKNQQYGCNPGCSRSFRDGCKKGKIKTRFLYFDRKRPIYTIALYLI